MKFSFRLLERRDFPLVIEWLAKPHVNKWWQEPAATIEGVEEDFGGSIDGTEPTGVYIAAVEGKPIGIIQAYLVADYPEHAESVQLDNAVGVDLFIGEEDFIGKGYGSAMLTRFIEEIIRDKYTAADCMVADPEVGNAASIRTFEKAGFQKGRIVPGEHGPEQLMIAWL